LIQSYNVVEATLGKLCMIIIFCADSILYWESYLFIGQ
jgi:hypothetical protein